MVGGLGIGEKGFVFGVKFCPHTHRVCPRARTPQFASEFFVKSDLLDSQSLLHTLQLDCLGTPGAFAHDSTSRDHTKSLMGVISWENARTMVNSMKIDITGLIKLFFLVLTHPIGAYRMTRIIIKWLNTNKLVKFNPEEDARTHASEMA